jgi:hypothetical protein
VRIGGPSSFHAYSSAGPQGIALPKTGAPSASPCESGGEAKCRAGYHKAEAESSGSSGKIDDGRPALRFKAGRPSLNGGCAEG